MSTDHKLYETSVTVLPEWIDLNGHMNIAFYVSAFEQATAAVFTSWGLGYEYPAVEGFTTFTLGMNLEYISELKEGDPLRITTQLMDWDHKRIHYFHHMYHAETDQLSATNECLSMNIDLTNRRSAPLPKSIQAKLEQVWAIHQNFDTPATFGRKLGIRRK